MASAFSIAVLCSLLFFVTVVHCDQDDDEFEAFKQKHGKQYKDKAEHELRKKHHKLTKSIVDKHNKEHSAGQHSYWLAVNHMADMTPEERRKLLPKKHSNAEYRLEDATQSVTAPTTYKDWTTTGMVPPVRSQATCGSCWAFSSSDSAAYYYAAANGLNAPLEFSTQEIVDCALAYGGYPGMTGPDGCKGGFSYNVYNYIQAKGVAQDYSYQYTSSYSGSCKRSASAAVSVFTNTTVKATAVAGANNETGMAAYLGTGGPGVVTIFAECDQFMHYGGGIITNLCATCTIGGNASTCAGTDHDVLAVGYLVNSTTGTSYYKVKNSWNTGWGESGYFRANFGTNELNIKTAGVQYPVGIGKSATPARPLPFEHFCQMPAKNTYGGACLTSCNAEGACCSSGSSCYSGFCDPQAGICMPACTSTINDCNAGYNFTQGYSGPSMACVYYSGSKYSSKWKWGATCVKGFCTCNGLTSGK